MKSKQSQSQPEYIGKNSTTTSIWKKWPGVKRTGIGNGNENRKANIDYKMV